MWATHTHCAQTYIPSRHISTWHKINIFLKPYVTFFSYHYFGILKIIINHSDHWTISQSFSFLPVISTKFIKILFDLNSGPKVHTWQFIYYTHHLVFPFQKKKKKFSHYLAKQGVKAICFDVVKKSQQKHMLNPFSRTTNSIIVGWHKWDFNIQHFSELEICVKEKVMYCFTFLYCSMIFMNRMLDFVETNF